MKNANITESDIVSIKEGVLILTLIPFALAFIGMDWAFTRLKKILNI